MGFRILMRERERERERVRDYMYTVHCTGSFHTRGAKMCVVKKKRVKVEGISSGQQQIIARE